MCSLAPGRQLLAAPIFAVLALLSAVSGADLVLAGDDPRTCLMHEADQLFRRLAVAIAAAEIDPATIDDAYVARERELLTERCAKANGRPAAADVAAFEAHMARWSYHLDRKLSEITARGASD